MKRNAMVVLALGVIVLGVVVLAFSLTRGGPGVRRGIAYQSGSDEAGSGWIYFTPLTGTDPVRFGKPRRLARGSDPLLSPDGQRVLFTVTSLIVRNQPATSRLYSISSGGGKPKLLRETESFDGGDRAYIAPGSIVWSPDSQHLAIPGDDLRIVAAGSGKVQRIIKNASWPSFSPDSRSLAYVLNNGSGADLYITDRDSGKTRRLTHLGDAGDPFWGPKEIAFTHSNGIWLCDQEGKHLLQLGQKLIVGSLYGNPVGWSSDGRRLLTEGLEPGATSRVVAVPSGSVVFSSFGSANVYGLGLSRSGRLALFDTCAPPYWQTSSSGGVGVATIAGGLPKATAVASGACSASWNA